MDLEYLNGVEENNYMDYLGNGEFDELGELAAFFSKKQKPANNQAQPQKKGFFKKVGNTLKKTVHVVNKVNPATVLLRNGLLASMKLNLMKVAGNMKWAYLSEQQAKEKGVLPDKHRKLKEVLVRLEKIFHGAGGQPVNLKKAILTGKGNAQKQVALAGLNEVVYGIDEYDTSKYDEYTPLSTLLGHDVYYSENEEGMEGLGELGEPATAAAIAAASGAVASIAVIIKNIGDIFPKGNKNDDGGGNAGSATEQVDIDTSDSGSSEGGSLPAARTISESGSGDEGSGGDAPKEGFWDKNKSWLKPTAIGVGGLTAIYLISQAIKPKPAPVREISGMDGTTKPKPKAHKRSKERKNITPLALM